MVVTQSDLLDVPASQGTVLTIREGSSYQRTFCFTNRSAVTLAIQIEESLDGGATWSVIGTAFSLGAGLLVVKEIPATSTGILRVRASGGGNDRDLDVTYFRCFDDGGHVWTNPLL